MKAQKGGKPYEERQKALKQPINLHFIYISNTNGEKLMLFAVCVFHKCSVKLSIRRRILIYGKNPRRLYELLIYVVCVDWKRTMLYLRRLRLFPARADSVRGHYALPVSDVCTRRRVVCADWKHNAYICAACDCFLHAPTVYEVTTRRLRPMSAYTDSVRGHHTSSVSDVCTRRLWYNAAFCAAKMRIFLFCMLCTEWKDKVCALLGKKF